MASVNLFFRILRREITCVACSKHALIFFFENFLKYDGAKRQFSALHKPVSQYFTGNNNITNRKQDRFFPIRFPGCHQNIENFLFVCFLFFVFHVPSSVLLSSLLCYAMLLCLLSAVLCSVWGMGNIRLSFHNK